MSRICLRRHVLEPSQVLPRVATRSSDDIHLVAAVQLLDLHVYSVAGAVLIDFPTMSA